VVNGLRPDNEQMIFNHRDAVNISCVYYYFILVLKIVNLTRQYHFFIVYSNFDLADIKAELFDMFKNEWCLFLFTFLFRLEDLCASIFYERNQSNEGK
jgi:hypothetical protein